MLAYARGILLLVWAEDRSLSGAMLAAARAIELDSTDALGYALRLCVLNGFENVAIPKRSPMLSAPTDESQRCVRALVMAGSCRGRGRAGH